MVKQIYRSELQLNKANSSDTEASFLGLYLAISDSFVSSKIYDRRAILILILIFLALHLTGFIYHSLFGLLECLVLSLTLTLEIKF